MISHPVFKFKRYRIIILVIIGVISNCAYYNTMFNAFKLYDEGIKKIANSKDGRISPDIKKDFNSTIDKCWTLINVYSDSNKWADDALLLIGKSHYQIEEYGKSVRFLDQFIKKYPRSDLIYEAKIWYAKTLIKLDEDDMALEILNTMLAEDMNSDLKAEVLYSMGELYYKRGELDYAIKNLKQCVEYSDDDILSASSQYLVGNIYLEMGKYVDAIENFNYVLAYDPLEEVEFNALMKKVEAQIALKKIDLAINTLNQMLRSSKLLDKHSQVEAKLGECFRLQNKHDFATEHYLDVIQKYPRTLGSAQATYELAKLLEFYYTDLDSARKMYLKVRKESNSSEYVEDATIRANLLKNYLDLRSKISQDYEILLTPFADSTNSETTFSAADDSLVLNSTLADSDSINVKGNVNELAKHEQLIEQTKISLAKNQYALAEFFLLNMQNYDSAAIAYKKFIDTGYDSSKIPQAYHALSYLYSYKLPDSTIVDSIDNLILYKYPNSPYSEYILIKRGRIKKSKSVEIDTLKQKYRMAEDYLWANKYEDALQIFSEIAKNDSGSYWAGKSRYAISWIYENKLKNISKAIESYTILAKEYPKSDYAAIAKNKISEPEIETPVDTTKSDSIGINSETEINTIESEKDKEEFNIQREQDIPEDGKIENIDPQEEEREKSERESSLRTFKYLNPLQIDSLQKGNYWKNYTA